MNDRDLLMGVTQMAEQSPDVVQAQANAKVLKGLKQGVDRQNVLQKYQVTILHRSTFSGQIDEIGGLLNFDRDTAT
jgi:hypothetical protein